MTVAASAPAAQGPPSGSRMSLTSIAEVRPNAPPRIGEYGPEGVGKSTLAASADSPIFIPAETGLARVRRPDNSPVKAFPEPKTWQDVLDAVQQLITGQHDFRTVVFDTLDAMEPLLWKALCARNGWANIESPGYGK